MNLLKFNLKKELKKNTNIFLIIVIFLYFISIIPLMNYNDRIYKNDISKETIEKESTFQLERTISRQEMEEDNSKTSEAKLDMFKSIHSKYVVEKHYYKLYANGKEMTQKDKESVLAASKNFRGEVIEGYELGYIDDDWLSRRNLNLDQLKTEYDYFTEIQKSGVDYEINPYTINLKNYFTFIFEPMNIFIIMVLVLILSVDTYLDDFEDGTYKTLYSSPYKRSSLLINKFLSKTIVNLILILIPATISSIIVWKLYGLGGFNYPMNVSKSVVDFKLLSSNNPIYIPYIKAFKIQLLGFISIIVFQTIIVSVMTILFKDRDRSFSIAIFLMVVSYISFIFNISVKYLNSLNPWYYMNLNSIFSLNNDTTIFYGIILQLVLALTGIGLSIGVFNKRDLS